MAQEKDLSNKNSPDNSDNEDDEISNGNYSVKPDLGFENVNYTSNVTEPEGNRVEKKTTNQVRKEESPFSFKHFLKRDLSLPSTSASASTSTSNSYEGTGARPKVLSSPHQAEPQSRPVTSPHRGARVPSPHRAPSPHRTEPVSSPYRDDTIRVDSDNMAALGLPSLPDFVQDHLLLEQAYLGAGAPLDLDNLPDFTFTRPGFRPSAPPARLALDLTDCVERPQPAPHPFPLDLPTASGGESMRLPDFLPSLGGRGGPGGERGERERDRRRGREREAAAAEERRHGHQQNALGGSDANLVAALRLQIEQLQDELRSTRAEVEELRGSRRGVARSLVFATNTAESSLRELLSGLEQVRALASSLEPP